MRILREQLKRFTTVFGRNIPHSSGAIEEQRDAFHITPAVLEVRVNRRITLQKVVLVAKALGLDVNQIPDGRKVHVDIDSHEGNWGIIIHDIRDSHPSKRTFHVYSAEVGENPKGELTTGERRKIYDFFNAVAGKN